MALMRHNLLGELHLLCVNRQIEPCEVYYVGLQ